MFQTTTRFSLVSLRVASVRRRRPVLGAELVTTRDEDFVKLDIAAWNRQGVDGFRLTPEGLITIGSKPLIHQRDAFVRPRDCNAACKHGNHMAMRPAVCSSKSDSQVAGTFFQHLGKPSCSGFKGCWQEALVGNQRATLGAL